jgi:hypothetical protein
MSRPPILLFHVGTSRTRAFDQALMACCDTGPGGFGSPRPGGRGGLDCVPILAPPNGMVLNMHNQRLIDSLLDRREKTTFHLLAFPEGVRIEKNKYIGKGFMSKKQKYLGA